MTTATTATQHAPDLSALTPTERLNIAVAETQGAKWVEECVNDPEPCLWFRLNDYPIAADGNGTSRFPVRYWGPNYAGDPSAWGALMEKEGVWAQVSGFDETGRPCEWEGVYRLAGKVFDRGAPGVFPSAGRAICVSVLAKYGVDLTPYIGD